jgi:hypothetical protein
MKTDIKDRIDQVKRIDIVSFLTNSGYKFSRKTHNGEYVFNSPIRNGDSSPSFVVNTKIQKWRDWATGMSGDIINLVCLLYKTDKFIEAVEILEKTGMSNSSNLYTKPELSSLQKQEHKPAISVIRRDRITTKSIINYLERERQIPSEIWRMQKNLFEIDYQLDSGKSFYAQIAWLNDKGGYEIRPPYKTKVRPCVSPKTITTINGFAPGTGLNVFEGFINYFSALTKYKVIRLKNTTIVLNGLSLVERDLLPIINDYSEINLFLDNDLNGSGQAKAKIIQSKHPNCINRSEILFPEYNDFNDWIRGIKLP